MLESFIYSFNSIAPIFLLVLFGMFLKKIKFLKDDYCAIADKMVFNFALPFETFRTVSKTDIGKMFTKENVGVIVFFFVGIIIAFAVITVLTALTIKDDPKRGAFIQGSFRGNFAVFAIPLANNMFGEAGAIATAPLLPIVVIMYNVLAVVGFSIFAPKDESKKGMGAIIAQIAKSSLKNPLVLSIFIGLAFSVLRSEVGISMPVFIQGTIEDIAALAVPLALISIGVNFKPDRLKGGLKLAAAGMAIKNIILPLVAVAIGVLMGFRGIALTMILISFGSPTSVSSYIMAKNMHGDHELAGQILLLSTVCSLATIFGFIFVLKALVLI